MKLTILALLLSVSCHGQRLLRSHLIQPEESDTVCVMVLRDVDEFSNPRAYLFRLTNAVRLPPGDYQVAYFLDTAFVNAQYMHVSHDPSVMDQFILVGDVKLKDVRFGPAVKDGNVVAINLDALLP